MVVSAGSSFLAYLRIHVLNITFRQRLSSVVFLVFISILLNKFGFHAILIMWIVQA